MAAVATPEADAGAAFVTAAATELAVWAKFWEFPWGLAEE
jgi:hypothetical protein